MYVTQCDRERGGRGTTVVLRDVTDFIQRRLVGRLDFLMLVYIKSKIEIH